MKVMNTVILALALILGVNSLPNAASKEELVELVKGIPRHRLGMYQSDILVYLYQLI
jgi:hypothetical protein